MPCSSHDQLMRISNAAETRMPRGLKSEKDDCGCGGDCCGEAKGTRREQGERHKKRWEKFRERGITGISTLDGGGLTSTPVVLSKALTDRQQDIYDDLEETVEQYGKFDWGIGPNGAHYVPAGKNPFKNEGLVCSNCAFWQGPNGCEIVKGELDPNAVCKFWIIEGSRVKEKGVRRARRDRLAATPAPLGDRVFGSRQNPQGSASGSKNEIEMSEATIGSLRDKVRAHNAEMRKAGKPEWSMATLGQLKAVYRRGGGAFSQSHRPGMTRGQWSMGRVNAFLKILSSGKPANSRYTGDNDLLRDGHPWKKSG